jgi:hypothetical protein
LNEDLLISIEEVAGRELDAAKGMPAISTYVLIMIKGQTKAAISPMSKKCRFTMKKVSFFKNTW